MKPQTQKKLVLLGVLGVLGVGALGGALFVQKQVRASKGEAGLREAFAAYEAGNFTEAVERYQDAWWWQDGRPDHYFAFADARWRVPVDDFGHVRNAFVLAQQAATEDPSNIEAQRLVMRLARRIGRTPEGLSATQSVLTTNPDDLEALLTRSALLRESERTREALVAAEEAAEAHPSSRDAHFAVIELLNADGASIEEVASYVRDVARPSIEDRFEAEAIWALVASQANDFEEALDTIESMIPRIETAAQQQRVFDLLEAVRFRVPLLSRDESERAGRLVSRTGALFDRVAQPRGSSELDVVSLARSWVSLLRVPTQRLLDSLGGRVDELEAPALFWFSMLAEDDQQNSDAIGAARARLALLAESAEDPLGAEGLPLGEEQKVVEYAADDWLELLSLRDAFRGSGADAKAAELVTRTEALLRKLELARFSQGAPDTHGGAGMARYLHANALRLANRDSEAIASISELRPDPAWRRARLDLARWRYQQQQFNDALGILISDLGLRQTIEGAVLLAQTRVLRLESGAADQSEIANTVGDVEGMIQSLRDSDLGTGELVPLLIRAYVVGGETYRQRAAELIAELTQDPEQFQPGQLLFTASRIENEAPELAQQLRDAVTNAAPDSIEVLEARLNSLMRSGELQDAERLVQAALANADDENRAVLELLRLRVANVADPAAARGLMEAMLEAPSITTRELNIALSMNSVWADDELAGRLIERLREMTGEDSPGWRIYEGQRLVQQDDPSEADLVRTLQLVRDVLALEPANVQARVIASRAYEISQEPVQAENILKEGLAEAGPSLELYGPLLRLLYERERFDELRVRLAEFARLDGLPPELERERIDMLLEYRLQQEALPLQRALAARTGEPADKARLGRSLSQMGQADRAAQQFSDWPNWTEPADLGLAAEFYISQQNAEEAMAVSDRVMELRPGEDIGPMLRADVLQGLGREDEALAYIREALPPRESAAGALWVARNAARRGDVQAARDTVAEGLRAGDDPRLTRLSELLEDLPEQGVWAMRTLGYATRSAVRPGDPVLFELAKVARGFATEESDRAGLIEQSRAVATDRQQSMVAWALLLDAHATPDRGSARLTDAQYRRMMQVVQEVQQRFPEATFPLNTGARVAADQGDLDTALSFARRWREAQPDSYEAAVLTAKVLAQRGDTVSAGGLLSPFRQQVLAQASTDPEAVLILLVADAADGRVDRIRQGLNTLPEDLRAGVAVDAANSARQLQTREAVISEFIDLDALTPRQRAILANGWVVRGRQTGDSALFQRAIETLSGASSGDETQVVATAFTELGDTASAIAAWRSFIERNPDDAMARLDLARLYLTAADDPQQAEEEARRAMSLTEGQPRATSASLVVRALVAQDRLEDAVSLANQNLAELRQGSQPPQGPAMTNARVLAAEVSLLAGDRERAGAVLSEIESAGVRADAAVVIGSAVDAAGRIPDAVWAYRKALEANSDHIPALNNIAYAGVKTGAVDESMEGYAERAFSLLERANAPASVRASVLDTLGWVQIELGKHRDARQTFRIGLQASEEMISLWLGLALAEAREGRADDAARSLAEAERLLETQAAPTDEVFKRHLQQAREAVNG